MATPPSTIAVEVNDLPKCSVWPARKEHRATVFFLHGLGDTAVNLGYLVSDIWKNPLLDHVKLIMPTAPLGPLSFSNGRIMSTWFDVFSFNTIDRKEDESGLYRAASWLNGLIKAEHEDHDIPISRIIIGGISQGGAVSLLTALTTFLPIGGVFVLSSYIVLRKKIHELLSPNAKELSIFWGHGTSDKQVPYDAWKGFAENLAGQIGIPFILSEDDKKRLDAEELKTGTKALRFFTYHELGHWFNREEIDDLITWISVIVGH